VFGTEENTEGMCWWAVGLHGRRPVRKNTSCDPSFLVLCRRTLQQPLPARAEHRRVQHPNSKGGGPPMPNL